MTPRKSLSRHRLAVVLAVALLSLGAGCHRERANPTERPMDPSMTVDGAVAGSDAGLPPVGAVTLEAAAVRWVANVGRFEAEPGEIYAVVQVSMGNGTGAGIPLDAPLFAVRTGAGIEILATGISYLLSDGCPDGARLGPGAEITCSLAFAVPNGTTLSVLIYSSPEAAPIEAALPPASVPTGACTSASDQAALARSDYGPSGTETFDEASFHCAIDTIGAGGVGAITSCIEYRTRESATTGCTACYGMVAQCIIDGCVAQCYDGLNTSACLRCACGITGPDCLGMWESCTGLTRSECDGV